jgi:hypothetical protein
MAAAFTPDEPFMCHDRDGAGDDVPEHHALKIAAQGTPDHKGQRDPSANHATDSQCAECLESSQHAYLRGIHGEKQHHEGGPAKHWPKVPGAQRVNGQPIRPGGDPARYQDTSHQRDACGEPDHPARGCGVGLAELRNVASGSDTQAGRRHDRKELNR